jgi:hypothetical protein
LDLRGAFFAARFVFGPAAFGFAAPAFFLGAL